MAKYPYNTTRWQKLRKRFLIQNPLCEYCKKSGRLTPAIVVDHKEPHKGDESLMWAWNNFQSLCKRCHDNAKQLKEIHGYTPGSGIDGQPIDDNHPWSKT